MKKIALIVALVSLCVGCDRQRDLYDIASPLLSVEGDWMPSLNIADMSGKATAMLYREDGGVTREFFYRNNTVTPRVSRGEYDILIFNGLMFSETNTNLDHILFRNTDRVQTFEAFVVETAPNRRLVRAEGEYIASNDMELLTVAHTRMFIEGEPMFFLKYRDGSNCSNVVEDHVEAEALMTPRAVNYYAQVFVHLVNPSSADIANGALRGFVGSVFMEDGMPSHLDVTHQLRLNNLKITRNGGAGDPPETGTIESPRFVTFGPPLDLPDRRYALDISIVLKNGQQIDRTFDVTEQILPVIEEILADRESGAQMPLSIFIPVEIWMELPEVETGASVGVNDWGDDELITVKI